MNLYLKLISTEYLQEYSKQLNVDWPEVLGALNPKSKFSAEYFEYYIISSSLYSSKIKGNTLVVNSFFRNRAKKKHPKNKEVEEIENLMMAYKFASENKLNKSNLPLAIIIKLCTGRDVCLFC